MRPRFCLLVVFLPGVLLSGAGSGHSQETVFESKHVAKLKYVTSIATAPDGRNIAYTVVVPRRPLEDDNGPAWSELHVSDLTGNTRPFVTGKVSIGKPQWSDDGHWIYYAAKRNDDSEKALYRIAVDGGESIRVFSHPASIGKFDVSPDGSNVAFIAKSETEKSQKDLQEKGFDQEIYEEDWKRSYVWVTPLEQDPAASDSDAKARMLELDGSALDVSWSPSGRELMVVLAPTPSVDDSYMHKSVHVVDIESGEITHSVNHSAKLGQVAWSPDGKRLALVAGEDIHDPHEGRLLVATIEGDEPLLDLSPKIDAHIGSVAWKDDSHLYWLAAEGVSSRFGIVSLDAMHRDLIKPGSETVFDDLSVDQQGNTIALLGHSAKHTAEVFVAGNSPDAPTRITDVNPWLKEMRFARQTAINWQARDGLELGGVLVYPLEYVEGRRYPTIMYVHGGPESHESNGWLTSYSRPGQVAAAKGFAVFYPNYRGSTGRGVKFSKMGQEDAAGREFDDLVDGVDHLIELGVTDAEAVGVTGGSYGGYASAWCSTYYSERFAASVMFVGISDNVSKVGTTDIPEEMFLVHHRKRLWDDWEYFLERSPIRYVEKNQTPTLIMHGKEDPRVHPSQSLELFRHLKTLDQAPVRLVLYEGEGHGNRKAASRLDYNLRMLRWMEHFLQQKAEEAPPMEFDYREILGVEAEEE